MAKFNATNVKLLIGLTEIGNLISLEIETSREMIDTSSKSSGDWKEHLVGIMDWKGSGELIIDYALPYAADDIFNALVLGTDLVVKFGVPGSGNISFSGTAHYTQTGQSASFQDKVTAKFSLEGTGPLTMATEV